MTSVIIFSSCNKSEQEKSWELFINNHKENSESFFVTAATIDTIEGNDKLNLIINATNFHFSNGNQVTTDIEVKMKDVLKRKDIIYEGLFTSFVNFSEEWLLKSKGMFKVDFFSEGQRVYPDTNITFFWRDELMNSGYFFYRFIPGVDSVWRSDSSSSFFYEDPLEDYLVVGQISSDVFNDTLSWINLDAPVYGPAPRRQIIVQTYLANFPISGYLILNNYLSVVRLKPHGCSNCFIVDNIPNNANATILVVGFDAAAEQYYLSRNDTIVGDDIVITADFQQISEQDLEIEIENLN